MARKRPSPSSASSTVVTLSRACVSETKASGTVPAPLHRPSEFPRRPEDEGVFGIDVLHPESAPDVGRDDAQPGFRNVQHAGAQAAAHAMRNLIDGVKRVPARAFVEFTDGAARLHGVDDDPVVDDPQPDHAVGIREGPPSDARRIALRPVDTDVSRRFGPELRRMALDRVRRIGHERQGPIGDLDRLHPVARGVHGFARRPGQRNPPRNAPDRP